MEFHHRVCCYICCCHQCPWLDHPVDRVHRAERADRAEPAERAEHAERAEPLILNPVLSLPDT